LESQTEIYLSLTERLLKSNFKKYERTTAVWQNGGFSAKFNSSSSIEHLCKNEHLCFGYRHCAKLQNVSGNFAEPTVNNSTNKIFDNLNELQEL
jgi:hypothetical protein